MPVKLSKPPQSTLLGALFAAHGLPLPVLEYHFAVNEGRKWRFDYSWPMQLVALEIEGGIWTRGRHTRGKGFLADLEKYNYATCKGWRVIRCTPRQLQTGEVMEWLKKLL